MFDAGLQTALQKYTCWEISEELGRALVGSRAIGYQYLAALLIKFYLFGHGTLTAQPHYLLFQLRRKPPSQGSVDGKTVDFACPQSLELGVASRVNTLTYR